MHSKDIITFWKSRIGLIGNDLVVFIQILQAPPETGFTVMNNVNISPK